MSEKKKNNLDDKLKNIKEELVKQGYVSTWDSNDGSAFKVAKKEWDPKLWKVTNLPKSYKWPHNSFWIKKKEKYICELAWWAAKNINETKRGLQETNYKSTIENLINVCKGQGWDADEAEPWGNKKGDQTGIRIKIAEFSDENVDKFVDDIVEWEKRNMISFLDIQQRVLDGQENAKNVGQRLLKEIQMKEYIDLLLNNHNIILHGAPGTGKTYLAKDIAKQLIFGDDEVFIDKTDDKLDNDSEKIEKRKKQEAQFNEQYCFVQFHQSYDYTDFVEGLRPKDDGKGNIVFERKDGVFKEFCKKAIGERPSDFDDVYTQFIADVKAAKEIKLQTPVKKNYFTIAIGNSDGLKAVPKSGKEIPVPRDELKKYYETGEKPKIRESKIPPIAKYLKENYSSGEVIVDSNQKNRKYIFVIDEINRGEMSKIFGELFFSIDPGYRGIKGQIKTQYQNLIDDENDEFADGFYVPENVYIIGTMNDIDRSVESMDFAMRRRFAFKEITAAQSQESMFGDVDKWEKSTKKKITTQLLDKLKNRMNNLNKAILDEKYHLGQAYQIGGAYFLKFAKYYTDAASEKEAFKKLWENHIAGVVKEYLRGIDDKKETLFGELKNAYYKELDSASTQPVDARDVNNAVAETGAGGEN